ncbi:MAG: VOC family protein [Dehalococcoidia bacterium]|nr:VOC family protein [Dehalococcoidia bacterium]MCA9844151.1 VOC family protein [Dehalococcoidia bacterium]
MEVQQTIINITSTEPMQLYEFYRDKIGLPELEGMGELALNAGGAALTFDGHSEIAGPAREPARYLVNLMVGDLGKEHDRIVAAGVPCIRDKGLEFWGGIISTFVDPDGNYIQVMEYDPTKATEPAAAGTGASE